VAAQLLGGCDAPAASLLAYPEFRTALSPQSAATMTRTRPTLRIGNSSGQSGRLSSPRQWSGGRVSVPCAARMQYNSDQALTRPWPADWRIGRRTSTMD
jgi:hypothetical protein